MLALVRSQEDFARACSELSDFFAFRWQRRDHAMVPDTLLGVWVGTGTAAEVPSVLTSRAQAAASWPIQIRETVGLSGIWTVCWLETLGGKDPVEVSRLDLLGALVESAGQGDDGVSPGRFAPVFGGNTAPSAAQVEIRGLQKRYSLHLMAPVFQHMATGRLSPPHDSHESYGFDKAREL